jgi:hypothetical protein
METNKHIGKYVQIDFSLIPRWGVIKINIELQESMLNKELQREDKNAYIISQCRSAIHYKNEELKLYTHLFN